MWKRIKKYFHWPDKYENLGLPKVYSLEYNRRLIGLSLLSALPIDRYSFHFYRINHFESLSLLCVMVRDSMIDKT